MTSPDRRGGARLMVGFKGTTVTPELVRVLEETGARAVILFARNIESPAQARDLIAGIRKAARRPLLFAVDQEGGAVARLTTGVTVFPGNMALGAADDPALALEQGRSSGRQLAALGFDLNLAPVVDLQTDPQSPIGIRSFGSDLAKAFPLASAVVLGHRESGMASCAKHFPGYGAATFDPHRDLAVIEASREEFFDPHVRMFERMIREAAVEAVMTTHLVVTGIDPALPATLSFPVVRGLLRAELGFAGLVIADDLEMGAMQRWGVAEAAVLAAAAGHDLLPVCHTPELQLAAATRLTAALQSGELDSVDHDASIARIDALCGKKPAGGLVDPAAGDAVAETIANRAVHLFGDPGKLIPIPKGSKVLVLVPRLGTIVAVEEEIGTGAHEFIGDLFKSPRSEAELVTLPLDPDQELLQAVAAGIESAGRIVLFTFDARGFPGQRRLLQNLAERALERTIFVHLRTPADQVLLPAGATGLTPFGYRKAQVTAVVDVLFGDLAPTGILPAPIR